MRTIKTQRTARGRSPDRRVRRARGALVLIALLASAALLLAACGGSSGNSAHASQNSSSGASQAASSGGSGTSESTADSTEAAKFSQCMRANGVPDFPDPGPNGQFQLKVTKGSDLDPNSSAYQGAIAKCKSLEPPGFGSSGQSTANQNQLLKFVSCMRKHGVPNFPDPGSSGQLILSSSQGIDPNSPAFQAAMQKCRSFLPNGGSGAIG